MPSAIKEMMVAELVDQFRDVSHSVLIDFTGMSAMQANELRAKLGEQGAKVVVVRNSMAVRALQRVGLDKAAELIDGPTAFVHGGDDPVTLSKTLLDWGKANGGLKATGALVEGAAIDAKGVAALAALPPVEMLHGMVVCAIASPLTGIAGVLQSVVRSFVTVVKAIGEKADEEG